MITNVRSTGLTLSLFFCVGMANATPNAINNLTASPGTTEGSVALNWAVPDLSSSATATSRYIIKYRTNSTPISTDSEFSAAQRIEEPPLNLAAPNPSTPGSTEATFNLTNLQPGADYSFSIKCEDSSGNRSTLSNGTTVQARPPCGLNANDGAGSAVLAPLTMHIGQLVQTTMTYTVALAGIQLGGRIVMQIPDFYAAPSTATGSGYSFPGLVSWATTSGTATLQLSLNGQKIILTVISGQLNSGDVVKIFYAAQTCQTPTTTTFRVSSRYQTCGTDVALSSFNGSMVLNSGQPTFLNFEPFEIVTPLNTDAAFDIAVKDGCGNNVAAANPISINLSAVRYIGGGQTSDTTAELSTNAAFSPSAISLSDSLSPPATRKTYHYRTNNVAANEQKYVQLQSVFGNSNYMANVHPINGGITNSSVDKGTYLATQKSVTFDPGKNERAYINFTLPQDLSWRVFFSSDNFVTIAKTVYGYGTSIRTSWDGFADPLPGSPPSIAQPATYAVRILVGSSIKDETCAVTLQSAGVQGTISAVNPDAVDVQMYGPTNRYTRTLPSGNYTIYGIGAGNYTLRFFKSGYIYKETTVTVTDGVIATVPTITLTQAAILRLSVTRPANAALPDITGNARANNSDYSKQAYGTVRFRSGKTVSDAGDDYNVTPTSFTDLYLEPSVAYKVTLEVPSHALDTFNITLPGTGVTHMTRTLVRQPTVEGKITLPTGSNAQGLWVSVEAAMDANSDLNPDDNDFSKRIYGGVYIPPGDVNGTYRIFGLANGTYVLSTWAQGFIRKKINVTVTGSDVTFPAADFPTLSQGGTVTGTLTVKGDSTILDSLDGTSDGLFSVPINIFSPASGFGNYTQIQLPTNATQTNGGFQIKGLEDGTYNMFIYEPGFGLNPPSGPSIIVSGGSGSVNLMLEQFSGKISGKITLPSGRSDYGTVEIEALGFNNFGQRPTATPDGSGNYEISGLGTDFYTVRARYPFTKLVVSQSVQITNGQTTKRDLDLSGQTYSISGRVTSTASNPYTISYIVNSSTPTQTQTPSGQGTLNANRVVATQLRGRNFNPRSNGNANSIFYDPKETFVGFYDANGDYTISGLAPGSYRLTTNGEIDGDLSDHNEVSETQIIAYISNQNLIGKDMTVSDGYKVSGTVRLGGGQTETGRQLNVMLMDSNGNLLTQNTVNLTGNSVGYSLDKVRPGNYVLTVRDSYPQKYSSKDQSVTVLASDLTNKEIQLVNSGLIKGRFQIKKSGVVISASNYSQYFTTDLHVEARSNPQIPGGYGSSQMPLIDSNGYFNVAVNPGTYDILVRAFAPPTEADIAAGKKQFVPITKSGITVSEGETKDLGFISLDEGIQITGTVRDSSGNPVPNVRITAQGARRNGHNDDNNLETFTNDSGKYAFHGIDSADERYYLFTAARRPDPFDTRYIGDTGLGRYGQVIRGPIDTQNITNVDFTLQPATSKITAHVGTSDGGQMLVPFGEEGDDNLPGAYVILNHLPDKPQDNPLGDLFDAVSGDGQMNVTGLAAGVYDLFILSRGYGSVAKRNVTVAPNQAVDLGTLTLPAGYTLSGKITKSNGDSVSQKELESVLAVRDNFNEISIAKMVNDASGNLLSYAIAGMQPNKAYTIVGFDDSNTIISLATNVTLKSDTSLDLTFQTPTPGGLAQSIRNNDGTFTIIYKFDDTLRNSDTDLDSNGVKDDNELFTLTTGAGTLSAPTISSDRRQAQATYTPGAGDSSFVITVHGTFVSVDDKTGTNHTINGPFTFFVGIARQNTVTLTNANGGKVDLSQANDGSSFTASAGFLGDDDTATADVVLKAAATQSALSSSALRGSRLGALDVAGRLGMKSYPSEMAAAMSRLKTLDVSPLSSFYDVFLPAGVSHFFPEGKSARICLTYDSSVPDPSVLNIYYYNSATNEYVLESTNKAVDTDNTRVCADIAHASVFTILGSSASIITGGGYTGELAIINFPNPFNLKQKTVTLQNPGTASASQSINGTMLKMSIPTTIAGTAQIQIFDVAGELVRTLHTPLTSGAHNYLEWDGRNDHDEPVASGTYIGRFTVDGGNEKFFKMAVLK